MTVPHNVRGAEVSHLLKSEPVKPHSAAQSLKPWPLLTASEQEYSSINTGSEVELGHHDGQHCNEVEDVRIGAANSWVPHALKRTSLLAFLIAYLLLIIALAVLFDYSNKHNGIVSSQENLHYLWTYGPTASKPEYASYRHLLMFNLVFTIIAAFWTKVDYHLKQLAPWRSLAAGQASAENSLLLDYISTWNIRVMFRSGKARQFDVTIGVAATLILQLMIIFSTGLFALEPQIMHQSDIPVTTNFNFAYRPNVSADSRDFMTAVAIQDYNLEYRHGTSEEFAYQTFDHSNINMRKYKRVQWLQSLT